MGAEPGRGVGPLPSCACLASADTQPSDPTSSRRAQAHTQQASCPRMLMAGLPGSDRCVGRCVQTGSHSHAPVGTTGSEKGELPCLWWPPGLDSGAPVVPCLSGLAEPLLAVGCPGHWPGKVLGTARGLDWRLQARAQTRGREIPLLHVLLRSTSIESRGKKAGRDGGRGPAETPTVPPWVWM